MNIKEKELTSKILKLASEHFSSHGCNDVDDSVYEGWTLEERQNFVKEFYEWNGDPEEYRPDFLNVYDYSLMSFLAYKLLK